MQLTGYRRVVPEGYSTETLHLDGTAPLLMNSGEADRDSDLYRSYFLLGRQRAKSMEDDARLRRMEWELRLYLDPDLGPFIPGKNIKEMLRAAATKWKKGEDIKRSLVVIENRIPLQYEGPRDEQGLWDGGFSYTTMVANNGMNAGRVLRCRPMFTTWSLDVSIAYDPDEIERDMLELIVERTQKYGLGDYRPEFGAFQATLGAPEVKRRTRATGLAIKNRNNHAEAAHDAHVARIMVPTS